jgi:hypothetical protein
VNLADLLVWGFSATVVLTTILVAAQAMGLTRIDLPFMIGSMFTPNRDRAKLVGYGVHLINGWLFAAIYAAAFETANQSGLLFGMLIGLVHGLAVAIVLMPLMPALHPRMASEDWGPDPTRQLEPPGNLALNYGISTPLVTVLAHVVYGGILGLFYNS